jgi:hypothetical protein
MLRLLYPLGNSYRYPSIWGGEADWASDLVFTWGQGGKIMALTGALFGSSVP